MNLPASFRIALCSIACLYVHPHVNNSKTTEKNFIKFHSHQFVGLCQHISVMDKTKHFVRRQRCISARIASILIKYCSEKCSVQKLQRKLLNIYTKLFFFLRIRVTVFGTNKRGRTRQNRPTCFIIVSEYNNCYSQPT